VITTTPKSKAKPLLQMMFMLDRMAVVEKKDDERWEQIQRSVDLLYAKVEAQYEIHKQMSVKDQLALAQQLTAANELVARLAADRRTTEENHGHQPQGSHPGGSTTPISLRSAGPPQT
jgi:hypothetical protein